MKEYGGYLSFELPKKREYFHNISGGKIAKLNSGRTAFWYAAKNIRPSKVYVPYLNCPNSVDPFIKQGIECVFYRLDQDLMPLGVEPKKNEAILWVNYYGNFSDQQIASVSERYQNTNLIIDNCHAFFAKPLSGCYNCYSTRKFFGVPDGAYLIADDLEKINLSTSVSYDQASFMLEAIDFGTNAAYPNHLKNEDRLAAADEELMSKLTRRILESVDYDSIKRIRRKNLLKLHAFFESSNEFPVNLHSETHMFYPLLVHKDGLRERLIARRVFMPTLWRHVPDYFSKDVLETELTKYMLLLPIDQRYGEEDMNEIADIVSCEIKKE